MEGLGSLLLFAVVFYVIMRFGCGAHIIHGHGRHARDKDNVRKHIDPVCGKHVDPEQGYGKMYEDTLYRFCSRACLDKFDSDPEPFLDKKKLESDHDK